MFIRSINSFLSVYMRLLYLIFSEVVYAYIKKKYVNLYMILKYFHFTAVFFKLPESNKVHVSRLQHLMVKGRNMSTPIQEHVCLRVRLIVQNKSTSKRDVGTYFVVYAHLHK